MWSTRRHRFCTSVREKQRQNLAAAVIDHAQQRVGFAVNREMRPIQRPSLIGFAELGWLPQLPAELQDSKRDFLRSSAT